MSNPAKYDSRLQILQATETPDDAGNAVESFALYITVWAKVRYSFGDEKFSAQHKHADAEIVFALRYCSDTKLITAKDVAKLGDVEYEILSQPIYTPGGRPTEVHLFCKTKVHI